MQNSKLDISDRYRPHHCVGLDCRLTNLRNLLDYFGHKESYSTVFGLSASFDFGYRRALSGDDRLQYPDFDFSKYFYSVTGHRFDCIEQMAFNCSACLLGNYPDAPESSLDHIRDFLAHSIPVMVAVSRKVISDYMKREDSFPSYLNGIEFGGHWVIVTALDDKNATATIFDTDGLEPIQLPLPVFQLARTYGDDHPDCLMKSRNRWVAFLPPAVLPHRSDLIRTALMKTVYQMKVRASAPNSFRGLYGIRTLLEDLPAWRQLPLDRLQASVFILHLNAEVLSRGLGRRLFASFLHQSSFPLRSRCLQEAADLCGAASEQWRLLIRRLVCAAIDRDAAGFPSDGETFDDILRLETRASDMIEEYVAKGN